MFLFVFLESYQKGEPKHDSKQRKKFNYNNSSKESFVKITATILKRMKLNKQADHLLSSKRISINISANGKTKHLIMLQDLDLILHKHLIWAGKKWSCTFDKYLNYVFFSLFL